MRFEGMAQAPICYVATVALAQGTHNNYAIPGDDGSPIVFLHITSLTGSGDVVFTGFAGGFAGRILHIRSDTNAATVPQGLADGTPGGSPNTGSSLGNRMKLATASETVARVGVILVYDANPDPIEGYGFWVQTNH